MARPKKERVFLDASVFVAASKSPSGGSSLVLEVCRSRRFRAVATRRVLLEAQRNIRRKFSSEELLRFYRELASLDIELAEEASAEEADPYAPLINARDLPVLASAIKSGADFPITLDRRHFQAEEIMEAGLPIHILTPGQFLDHLRQTVE